MEIKIENSSISIEELPIQEYGNISIIPLHSESNTKMDILSLKKGLELGLVIVKECENSIVNTVMVTNNAVTPLILVDGDEITGAKQNRIVNTTILIPPKTTMPVSVSCTERGRWHFKGKGNSSNFDYSNYFANSNTRRAKSQSLYEKRDCQSTVWNSISAVEERVDYSSPTSALNDSYENIINNQDEFLKHFKCLDNQTGLIAIIDGEIIGVEIFANPQMYKDYHEKIIKSYVIDSINTENVENNLNSDEIYDIINNISNSEFRKDKTKGLGDSFKFSNEYGTGSALIYDGGIVHMPYFKNIDDSTNHYEDNVYPEIEVSPKCDVNYVSPLHPECQDDSDIPNINDLKLIEERFHKLIFHRAPFAKEYENFELPKITEDLIGTRGNWFPVPGMYGGFSYDLSIQDGKFLLVTSSWCRVVGDSGQRHHITKDSCELVEEGFV